MQPLVTAPMDNLYLDTYYYFVPNRIVWEHWQNFMGENTDSAWIPQTEYEIPQITAPSGGWSKGTIADYFGIPTGVDHISVNALPFRAYAKIMNEWFRDENLSQPLNIPNDDSTVAGVNTDNQVTDIAKGGKPFKAAKYHDYFTSALPSPQKGPDVFINPTGGTFPIVTGEPISSDVLSTSPMTYAFHSTINTSVGTANTYFPGLKFNSTSVSPGWHDSSESGYTDYLSSGAGSTAVGGSNSLSIVPNNLYADVSAGSVATTINQLRMAFQIQKLYERDARGGTRYIELLKSHFGVTSPDARLQRPEYLGGNRLPINISQVVQTSSTDSTSPQGNVAGYSLTGDTHGDFIHSFVEHGYVIGVMVARYDHTYQNGLECHWSRKSRFDYYFPVLANIGEKAVYNREIYLQGSNALNPDTGKPYDDEVFGYQEAWAEYRYKPSIVTGEMRSNYQASLDMWHFADDYNQLPMLSDTWIREDKSNVDRALTVQSSVADQLFADIFIENEMTRPMPLYSIPGMIDHN